jgi:hypothetical protein
MSGAYYIVLDVPEPGFDTFVNGKFLSRNSATLNRICQDLGLREFDDYVSVDPEYAKATIEENGGDPSSFDLPEEQWFSAREGIEFVSRLSSYIEAHSDSIENSEKILSDLQEYIQLFGRAESIQAKWHLDVDF